MKQTVTISSRGQITLPANLRKRFGIKDGGTVILEERENEIVIKPALVLEMEVYSDSDVNAWDEADRLDDAERQRVLQRLAARE